MGTARTSGQRVTVHRHGLRLAGGGRDGEIVPLYAGAMHYFRHPVGVWGPALDAIRAMGLRFVDVYVPWGVHETRAGTYDFGAGRANLSVVRFLRMVRDRDLLAIVRPGPHINAELTYFGLPPRIVWDPDCQAKTPRGNPVVLPMLPLAFPVPSYASRAFHALAEDWLRAVAKLLSPERFPDGPIAMVQVDNEGALYFRDGAYDQDYHPDAIDLFRDFLRTKYLAEEKLTVAWGGRASRFDDALPPTRFDVPLGSEATPHLDWMEFQELLLATGMLRFQRVLEEAGLGELPTMHNLPLGEAGTPLNAEKLGLAVDLVGLDYYHHATPAAHIAIQRRTSELAARASGEGKPAYGAEVGAGFPPFFPPHDEDDSMYTLMAALAYGLRGWNLYMAVERDRWIGSPIDTTGTPTPFAGRLATLVKALERCAFHTLTRDAPVRLLVPRSLRRLARATHAFGPVSPAIFNVMGAGFEASCLEDPARPAGSNPAVVGEGFLHAFERALVARGVPFAYAGGESARSGSLRGARWIVAATAGGLKPDLLTELRRAAAAGVCVTIGPTLPAVDGSLRPLASPPDTTGLELEPLLDLADADARVAARIEALGLPTFPAFPSGISTTLHEDDGGRPRIAFVMNPTSSVVTARVSFGAARVLVDLLDPAAAPLHRWQGGFEVAVPARTVRIFEVDPAQKV